MEWTLFSRTWPNPNSPILSKIDFGVPVEELFKWLEIRDTFLGQNCKKQDVKRALALACDCKHPDAVWLSSVPELAWMEVKEAFEGADDARALCFSWICDGEKKDELSSLRRAAEMGNAFACSTLSVALMIEAEEEAFVWAQRSAAQKEREGYYWLGVCFRDGIGCVQDLNLAKKNFCIAAELRDVDAARICGQLLDDSDPGRWIWLSRAARLGFRSDFLSSFSKQVEQFLSGAAGHPKKGGIDRLHFPISDRRGARSVFAIGFVLKENMDMEDEQVFGSEFRFESNVRNAERAIAFYEYQIGAARLAVDSWTIIGIRFGVVKDVRKLIGKLIWDARFEANYVATDSIDS